MSRRGARALTLWNVAVAVFVLSPLVVVILSSLTAAEYTSFPPEGLSLRWYAAIPNHPEFRDSLVVSVTVAAITGVLATVLGTLVALALARHRFVGRDALGTLFLAPLMLPAVILGIALLNFYTRVGITRTPFALVCGHLVITVPYVVRLVSVALAGLDPSLERAARGLGATPWQAFRRITLPLIGPGVGAGAAFAAITSFDDVSIALFLSGPRSVTLPVRIFTYIEQTFDPLVTAVCSLLVILALGAVVLIARTVGLAAFFGAGEGTPR